MAIWLTGDELLKDKYQDKKADFFKAIKRGELVPCSPLSSSGENGEELRIYPRHCDEILKKIARMEQLQRLLEKDDETLLWGHFCGRYGLGNDDEEEFRQRKASGEGQALLKQFSSRRPKWKEEFESLREELGDWERELSPSVVWRGVVFNDEDVAMLLKASYLVRLNDNDPVQENPKENLIVTKRAIADYLKEKHTGGKCSVSSIRLWIKEKPPLPHKKELNGRVSALPSELDEWWQRRNNKKNRH